MNFDVVWDSFKTVSTNLLSSAGVKGKAALNDLQDLINEMKPEVEDAVNIAVESGGQETDLNTLQAQANAIVARTTGNYDTFSATQKRDIRVALTSVLFTAVKIAVA